MLGTLKGQARRLSKGFRLKEKVGAEMHFTFPSLSHELCTGMQEGDLLLIYPPKGHTLCASSGQDENLGKVTHIPKRMMEGNEKLPDKESKRHL